MTYHGFTTTADGVFGSVTKSKVQQYQSAHGLTADGIVGPVTWIFMVPDVILGDSNYAVRAVQSLLNAKRDPNNPQWSVLTVDGIFGLNTLNAVKGFQSHMGLTNNGVVNLTTWKYLTWHYKLMVADSYDCAAGGQPASESWGTAATVAAVQRAGYQFNSQAAGDLPFWDFSHEHGTMPFSPHSSHARGMEVDIGIITVLSGVYDQCTSGRGVVYTTTSRYSQPKTKELVSDILAPSQTVKVIYYNDPYLDAQFPPFITPTDPPHDDHLHVRYCAAFHWDDTYPSIYNGCST